MVKKPPAKAGDVGLILGSGKSLEKEMATHSSILPGESHGQRSHVGYNNKHVLSLWVLTVQILTRLAYSLSSTPCPGVAAQS